MTTRAYSRIRTAVTGIPRCFFLNVNDAPVGARWELRCEDTTAALHSLTGWAVAHGVRLGGLEVAGPTLEELYVEVVS